MVCETMRKKDDFFIIHNIIGFKNEVLNGFGWDWVEYCNKNNIDADVFFSRDYQSRLSDSIMEKYKRRMLVIVDESAEWFDIHKKQIKLWLNYHGHLGQEIFLVAHNSASLPRSYRMVVETEYRAKSSIFTYVPFYFLYNRLLGGVPSGFVFEKKDQKIFDLYKSSDIKEGIKKKSLYMPVILLISVLGFVGFLISPSYLMHTHGKKKEDNNKKVIQAPITDTMKKIDRILIDAVIPFDKQYAYVGIIQDQPVFEDRKTGFQYPLTRIPNEVSLIKNDRANSCIVFSKTDHKIYTVYNFDRFVPKERSNVAQIENEGESATNRRQPMSNGSPMQVQLPQS
jgi:hypothetical protein